MTGLSRRWLLTGGIGSGKSTVRRLLERHGWRTIDADSVGRSVLEEEGRTAVAGRWPEVVQDGRIDRASLAGIVFADPGELEALERITHPLIFGRIEADLNTWTGWAVVEVPVLTSRLRWPLMVVDADDGTRRARALARGMDPTDLDRRVAAQASRSEFLAAADLVIPNHGSQSDLGATVDRLVSGLAGEGG